MPKEWMKYKIGDLCEFKYGKALKENNRVAGEYPVYGSGGIVGYHNDAITEKEALIIGRKGSVGEIYYSDKPCWPIDTTYYLKFDEDKIYIKWFANFLKTINLPQLNKSAAIPGLNREDVYRINISLPPIEDQIRIASLLSRIEELIAKRKESIRLLDEFVKSTFLEMFGDPVRNEKGWETGKLKDSAIVRIGPFGSLLHKEDYIENGIPLVNPSHISNMKIYPDYKLTISEKKKKELESYLLAEGDIILGRRGEIGRAGLITKKESGFLCGTGSMFIRPSNLLNSIYLIYFLSSQRVKEILESLAKGVTMKNINSGSIEELDILLPPISIQNKFNGVVDKVESVKVKYQDSLSELEKLYGSVSQRAFRGMIDLK